MTTTTTDPKRIDHVIDRSSGRPQSEYWGYYADKLIGIRSNHHECETMLDEHALNALDLDSRPTPRCDDCKSPLGDLGFCEECADRANAASIPLNIDDTQLAAAWRAYKAGAMLWTDVQAIQAGLMPRCADHDRPAAILLNRRPACPQCMDETEPVAA